MRNPDFVAYEHQRRKPACERAPSPEHYNLYYSLSNVAKLVPCRFYPVLVVELVCFSLIWSQVHKMAIVHNPKSSCVIRDYLMAFWLSPEVSTRDPIISPRALARGLIMVEG